MVKRIQKHLKSTYKITIQSRISIFMIITSIVIGAVDWEGSTSKLESKKQASVEEKQKLSKNVPDQPSKAEEK